MKKLLLWFVVLVMIITTLGSAFAVDFPDVRSSHPNYTAINFLRSRGVINGYEDGTYKPDRSVTRAEFLKIILLSAGHTVMPGDLDRGPFPDVPSTSWYFGLVNRALALGVISGYPDGTFQPDRTVNRVEALKIMLRANSITESTLPTGTSYSDVVQTEWYAPYARYAMTARLFDGSRLFPGEMMNRAQVAEMVYRFYQARPDLLPASTSPSPTTAPSTSPVPLPIEPSPTPSTAPTVTPSSSFHLVSVTNATALPASYVGSCPAWAPVTFSAQVITNGQAGVIAYRWERGDGVHMTNYQTLGIPSPQTSTTVSWSPNWDGSIHSSYRLKVLDNSDGTNAANSNYVDFAVDCTSTSSSSPSSSPTPTSSPLVVTAAYLSAVGQTTYTATCPTSFTISMKGSIVTNGQPGVVRYYYRFSEGTQSNIRTLTVPAGETDFGSSVGGTEFNFHIPYTNYQSNYAGAVTMVIESPTTLYSPTIPFDLRCAPDTTVRDHRVTAAIFGAGLQNPGAGGSWVCGQTNSFILRGRIEMSTPSAGGQVAYNWLYNTGATSPTFTATQDRDGYYRIILPDYVWTPPQTNAAQHYTVWLNVLTPNGVVSEPWSFDKPMCASL